MRSVGWRWIIEGNCSAAHDKDKETKTINKFVNRKKYAANKQRSSFL